eukprot:8341098-Pyramimonas_sp.AAC.1
MPSRAANSRSTCSGRTCGKGGPSVTATSHERYNHVTRALHQRHTREGPTAAPPAPAAPAEKGD